MKRMLINATQEEELRMAMVDGQRLYDLNIELPSGERKKANIYKGRITRIEPSLEAAFVNYGADRHGFLPLKEISSEYFINDVPGGSKANIREVLKEGQDIVVQIDKEERGTKGAALTTYVSLAGRFIVLKPNKARSGGVSRRIVGEERDMARQALDDVEIPNGMSVILRTAGIDRNTEELQWDMENLLAVWEAIKKVVVERPSPFLIYRESNAVIRALRDYLSNEIGEILIDDEKTFAEAKEFVEQVMPQNLRKLKLYTDPVPLFTRFQIESQIESAFAHSVNLPSGGSLVIDHTEALVSIDINSARATKGGDIEATALNTNLEAADEVGRQLRLRDLGGLVVIDFIDMGPQKNQREVENRLRDAVRQDRARVQIGKISRFGLLEMSRQRLRPSLGESSYLTCPRCSGIGNIRSVESLALAILRIIGEEARKERTAKVIAQLPVEVATYLLNEKRNWVQSLESRNDTQVVLVANSALETPHYQIRRVRDDQVELPENTGNSYTLADIGEEPDIASVIQEKKVAEMAAVQTIAPQTPAPQPKRVEKQGPGLLARILGLFSGGAGEKETRGKETGGRGSRKTESRGGQRGRRRSESQRGSDKRHARSQKTTRKRGGRDSSDDAGRQKSEGRKAAGNARGGEAGKQAEARQDNRADNRQESRQGNRQDGRNDRDESRPASGKAPGKRRSRGGRRRKRTGQNEDASETGKSGSEKSAARSETPPAGKAAERGGRSEDNGAARQESRERPEKDKAPAKESAGADRPAGGERDRKPKAPSSPAAAGADANGSTGQRDTSRRNEVSADDDTYPNLPRLNPAPERAGQQPPPAKERAAAAKSAPIAESHSRAAANESPAGNGKTSAGPAAPREKPAAGAEKATGRLLPWDSAAPVAPPLPASSPASSPAPSSPPADSSGGGSDPSDGNRAD